MNAAKEFVEHYKTSGQLKYDLEFLGLEGNDENAALLETVVWSSINYVVGVLSKQDAQ